MARRRKMTDAPPRLYGQRLKMFRERLGLTQESVAERLGRPLSTYRGLEIGGTNMKSTDYQPIAAALGVSLVDLLRELFEFELDPATLRGARLIDLLRSIEGRTPDEQDAIIRFWQVSGAHFPGASPRDN